MEDWLSFEGVIVAMEWGESVYTVLPLPDDIYDTLKAQGTKRVDVELNDCPFNMALTKAPVIDSVFIYAGKNILAAAEIEPGQVIDVRLRKADENLVEVPDDVTLALRQAGLTDVWGALSAGKKRGMLHTISLAKRAPTRIKRIQKLIEALTSQDAR